MCTVVLSFEPGERIPLLLLGVRDELKDRRWRPPARHWPGSPLIGGIDEQAGGTWLAVHPPAGLRQQESPAGFRQQESPAGFRQQESPAGFRQQESPAGFRQQESPAGFRQQESGVPRVSCLLNGRGVPADPARRRTRGELPLRAAAEGAGALKELADDTGALAAYDPFHLVCADAGSVRLLSWDGERPAARDLDPGTHVLINVGHAYPAGSVADPAGSVADPAGSVAEPKAAYFGPKFAAVRPSGDPVLPAADAWGEWLTLAAGDGLDPGDPRAIIARRELPDGRIWGSTSVTLVGLAADALRYDFQPRPGERAGWYPVSVPF